MSPEVIAKVLEARTVEDHLQVVQLFQPDSPLLRLIKMDGHHNPEPFASISSPTSPFSTTTRRMMGYSEISLGEGG